MIYYNSNTINDWNFGDDNIIKAYKHGAVVFYKFDSEQGGYKVCYAVVEDITQYSDTEFEDVYDKATEKWYKLNNLNQYEEYGIYGSGRTLCGAVSFTELTDIIAQSTTAITNHNITVTPAVGAFSKIRIDTTKSATTGPYCWTTFTPTPSGSEVLGINMNSIGTMNGYGNNKNYVTDANGSQTFAHWVDDNNTIVEIDIAALSNNQASELYLLFYQENCKPAAFSFYIESTDCVTTYNGKLTIDNGYEYEWNGSSWVNVGEVSGSSRVPGGYVELTHVQTIKQDVSNASAFTVPIDIQSSYNYIIEFMPLDWSNQSYYGDVLGNDGDTNFPSYGLFKLDNGWGTEWNRTVASFWNYSFDTRGGKPAASKYRFYDNTKAKVTMHLHNYDAAQGADMIVENEGYPTSAITSTSAQKSGYVVSTGVYNSPLFCTQTSNMIMTAYMNFYNLKIETNENVAVYDYIPCKRKSDNKVGLYDVVHNVFHAPLFKLNAGDEASHTEYPKYYSEKSDPPNNLTFNTMEEADNYAYNNCVYVGLNALIGSDKYVFSGDSQSGYEWVYNPSRLPVGYTEVEYIENVTPNKAYIDTGFKPNQNTRVIADLQYVTTNTHPRAFGCGAWNSVGYIFNAENGIPGEWRWKFGSNGNTWLTTGVASDFNRHKVEINNGNLYLDDVVIGSTTVTTFQLTDNIGLFGFIQNGSQGGTSAGEYMFGKFYSFKVYDNGTLERDLVPCKRDSDDKYGMYDIVNDVFYVSPNGDNFSGGDPV